MSRVLCFRSLFSTANSWFFFVVHEILSFSGFQRYWVLSSANIHVRIQKLKDIVTTGTYLFHVRFLSCPSRGDTEGV